MRRLTLTESVLILTVQEVYIFAKALVRIFSLALGLEETALDEFFETPFTDITINHYLPQPGETEYKQVLYPHADYGGKSLQKALELDLLLLRFSKLTCGLVIAFTLLAQRRVCPVALLASVVRSGTVTS